VNGNTPQICEAKNDPNDYGFKSSRRLHSVCQLREIVREWRIYVAHGAITRPGVSCNKWCITQPQQDQMSNQAINKRIEYQLLLKYHRQTNATSRANERERSIESLVYDYYHVWQSLHITDWYLLSCVNELPSRQQSWGCLCD
jgi:hypothetical protein